MANFQKVLVLLNRPQKGRFFYYMKILSDKEKLVALYKKLEEATEKYKFKLKNFRGVPHESAMGELSFSELKVREDFVESLKSEIASLETKMGIKK